MADYDVVISGMGVSGLVAALSLALKTDQKILIINNRGDDFLRGQGIFLDLNSRETLLSFIDSTPFFPEDHEFIEKIKHSPLVAIKEVERFLYRQINRFPQIDIRLHHELTMIDKDNGLATISPVSSEATSTDSFTASFRHLIGADGTRRHALSLMMGLSEVELRGRLKTVIETDKYRYNVSAQLRLTPRDGQLLPQPTTAFCSDVIWGNWCQCGLNENSAIKSDGQQMKCNIVAEIPQEIYNLRDPDERKSRALEHIIRMARNILPKMGISNDHVDIHLAKDSQHHGDEKNRLRLQLFTHQFKKAPFHNIEINGRYYTLLGDSYLNPFYPVGHGMNNAIRAADLTAHFIAGNISWTDYNKEYNAIYRNVIEQLFPCFGYCDRKLNVELVAGTIHSIFNSIKNAFPPNIDCDSPSSDSTSDDTNIDCDSPSSEAPSP